MVTTMNLKFEHVISRIEELDNGDTTSINRSRSSYNQGF